MHSISQAQRLGSTADFWGAVARDAGNPAPHTPDIQMVPGRHAGDTLLTAIPALVPLRIRAQQFLHGVDTVSIFQECSYVHKSKEDYTLCGSELHSFRKPCH